jgi:hypothetical protein
VSSSVSGLVFTSWALPDVVLAALEDLLRQERIGAP